MDASKYHRKGGKATAKSSRSKKASKSASRFERQKDKALEKIYKRASSQKPHVSLTADRRLSSFSRQLLQLSPEGREDRETSPDLRFPTDTSEIWRSVQDLHKSPHQGNLSFTFGV